jgi:hypothetical protein
MKNLLFLFLFSVLITSCVPQAITVKDFEKIIDMNNSKDELYIKTNEWFVETFNSAESVIEFQDKEAGKIIGKYVLNDITQGLYIYNIKQTISIDIKEGKVRIVIKDPYEKATGSVLGGEPYNHNYSPLSSQKRLSILRLEWDELSKSLEKRLNENSDW